MKAGSSEPHHHTASRATDPPEGSASAPAASSVTEAKLKQRLIEVLQKQSFGTLLWVMVSRLFRVLIILQMTGLLVLWLALTQVGEENLTSAFLLYLPPALWFIPVPLLILPALLFDRKGALLLGALTALLLFSWVQFRPSGPAWATQASPDELTVLTYNRGQQGSQSLQPFKNAMQPDLMVLQDAGNRAEGYLNSPGYSEFRDAKSVGEHSLVSRYPILDAALLSGAHPGPRAARFVIDWQGTPVAIYSVHLHTPRHHLQAQSRGGFLYGVLGLPGTPWSAERQERQVFWDAQLADAKALIEAVQNEPLPCIIVGDFNAPHLGKLYRLLSADLTDAHAVAGNGLGFTFPGTTRNPLSGGGPWLRIDYIFAGPGWQVESCRTEPDRTSQHRAVAARLRREPSTKPAGNG